MTAVHPSEKQRETTADSRARDERPASEYAYLVPQLRMLAALPPNDSRRTRIRHGVVQALLPVAQNLAGRYCAGHPSIKDELTQVGAIGLISAIDRWDPERSPDDVLGYVVPCIRGEILRFFRDRTWSTRVPRRLKELSVSIRRATGPLSQRLGRAPRPAELAAHLGVDVEEIIDALEAQDSQRAGSLEAIADEGSPLGERLGELDKQLDQVEYRHALRPLLERMPERERTILMLRFFGEQTQTQIAEQLGISQMHVSRLLSRTLAQLRTALLDDGSSGAATAQQAGVRERTASIGAAV